MTTTRQHDEASKERTMSDSTITGTKLIRWAGVPAMLAGVVFAAIQPIHPPDVVESVNTSAWAIITGAKSAMCLLFLVGITGIYARQVNRAGWLGLAGFVLLGVSWSMQAAFVFAESFIMPPLASTAPAFVGGFLGISYGHTGGVDFGALPALYAAVGITYMLGGLVFGIATLRAGVLPRLAAGLLAVAATLTPLAALLPHAEQRFAAVPVAFALAWLGYALFTEPTSASEAAPVTGGGAQLRAAAAE